MKKATLIIWVIIFGVMALVIFQNQAFFLTNQSLQVNLGVMEAYHTPELPIAIMVLLFFLTGILIAYLFNLSARFKARRTVKKLNTAIASHTAEVADLRRQIDSLKGIETAGNETDATIKLSSDSDAEDQAGQTGTFSIDSKSDDSTENSEEKNA
jgi:uncharacterized integral membrane protein